MVKGKKSAHSHKKTKNQPKTVNVSHTVEIQQVNGIGSFQLLYFNTLICNVPWLDAVATNFSRYKYLGASVEFIPHIGTSTQGQVALAFSYDETDNPPVGMAQIANMAGAVVRPIYAVGKRVICRANCKRQAPSYRYIDSVQYAGVPVSNRNDYNPFTLWFGTDTTINGQIIGTLHFSFRVLLMDPIFADAHVASSVVPIAIGLNTQRVLEAPTEGASETFI